MIKQHSAVVILFSINKILNAACNCIPRYLLTFDMLREASSEQSSGVTSSSRTFDKSMLENFDNDVDLVPYILKLLVALIIH